MSLNEIMLIGNAGQDAELRFTQAGRQVTNFSLAVNHSFQRNGEWEQETEWFRVAVWGDRAEGVAERVRKGSKVFVQGRLRSNEYTSQSGQARFSMEVNAYKVLNLTPRDQEQGDNGAYQQGNGGYGAQPAQETAYAAPPPAQAQEAAPEPENLEDLPW